MAPAGATSITPRDRAICIQWSSSPHRVQRLLCRKALSLLQTAASDCFIDELRCSSIPNKVSKAVRVWPLYASPVIVFTGTEDCQIYCKSMVLAVSVLAGGG